MEPRPACGQRPHREVTRGLAWGGRQRRAAATAPVRHRALRAPPGRGGRRPPAQGLPLRRRPAWGTRERSSLLPHHLSGLSDTRGSARAASRTPRPKAAPLRRREAKRMRSAVLAQAQDQAAQEAHGAGAGSQSRCEPLVSHLCFRVVPFLFSSRDSGACKPPHSLGIRINNSKSTNNQQLGLSTVHFEGGGHSMD